MEVKEQLLNDLKVPQECVEGLDCSDFPKLVEGTPLWARFYKILDWIWDKNEAPIKDEKLSRLEAYCCVNAAKDFVEKFFADETMLDWLDWRFLTSWPWILMDAADLYRVGKNGIPCDGERAIWFYEKAYKLDPSMIGALDGIGDVCYHGTGGVTPDYRRALKCFQKTDQIWCLGDYYSEGIAVTPDYPLAISYYLKALERCVEEDEYLHNEPFIALLHERLSICYEAIGDTKKAIEHKALIAK